MQLIDHPVISYKDYRQRVNFHHFTDLHMGAEGCDERQLEKDVARIEEGRDRGEIHLWDIGGDAINGIGPSDRRRYDATAVAKRFQDWQGDDLFRQQVQAVAEVFEPIRDCGVFVGTGNHEYAVAKNGDYNPAADLAQRLNLPYAGYSAGFRLRLRPRQKGAYSIIGYWHHGYGSGRTKGAKANLGARLNENFVVDVTLTGHGHDPIITPEECLTFSRRGKFRLIARDRLIIVGGSYLKTYPAVLEPQEKGEYEKKRMVRSDYGERQGYRPTVIGHFGFSAQLVRGVSESGSKDNFKVKLKFEDFR